MRRPEPARRSTRSSRRRSRAPRATATRAPRPWRATSRRSPRARPFLARRSARRRGAGSSPRRGSSSGQRLRLLAPRPPRRGDRASRRHRHRHRRRPASKRGDTAYLERACRVRRRRRGREGPRRREARRRRDTRAPRGRLAAQRARSGARRLRALLMQRTVSRSAPRRGPSLVAAFAPLAQPLLDALDAVWSATRVVAVVEAKGFDFGPLRRVPVAGWRRAALLAWFGRLRPEDAKAYPERLIGLADLPLTPCAAREATSPPRAGASCSTCAASTCSTSTRRRSAPRFRDEARPSIPGGDGGPSRDR